jgi:hypothetical protein
MTERDSQLRMALRHVQTGRGCIMRQQNVIASLRGKRLPTEEAEAVLHWLEETQRGFEEHYKKILSEGLAGIEEGYKAIGILPRERVAGELEGRGFIENASDEA